MYPLLRFVGLPSAPNVGLQLLLPRPNPRCVMLLGNAHTLMTQENCNALNRNARKQEFHRKRIAEAMGVAIWHASQNEKPLQIPLPIPHCTLRLRQSTPKEISARRNRVEGFHNEGRKRAINCGARLRRIEEKFIVLDKISAECDRVPDA